MPALALLSAAQAPRRLRVLRGASPDPRDHQWVRRVHSTGPGPPWQPQPFATSRTRPSSARRDPPPLRAVAVAAARAVRGDGDDGRHWHLGLSPPGPSPGPTRPRDPLKSFPARQLGDKAAMHARPPGRAHPMVSEPGSPQRPRAWAGCAGADVWPR